MKKLIKYLKYKKLRMTFKQKRIIVKNNVNVSLDSILEGFNCLYNNVELTNSYLGKGTYIANNSIIRKAKIGRFCAIGENVRTYLGKHPTKKFVSIHPSFFSEKEQAGFTFTDTPLFDEHSFIDEKNNYVVSIGNDVWIGNNVMITDGVAIGDGAIVAAGSIVVKDVEPYSIVGGVPAKHIRFRFNQKQINKLLDFKWWNKDMEWLSSKSKKFSNIEDFLNSID